MSLDVSETWDRGEAAAEGPDKAVAADTSSSSIFFVTECCGVADGCEAADAAVASSSWSSWWGLSELSVDISTAWTTHGTTKGDVGTHVGDQS